MGDETLENGHLEDENPFAENAMEGSNESAYRKNVQKEADESDNPS